MFNEFFKNNLYLENTILCQIMNSEGSDKGSGHHNYTTFYHYIFNPIKDEVTNVFELGLGTNNINFPCHMSGQGIPCSSLRGWKKYFTNAHVFGADIDTDILYQEHKMMTFFCDQRDPDSIKKLWNNLPQEFDIIFEDGLHTFESNITFFLNSHHKLKKGGIFIVEDIHYKDFSRFENFIESQKNNFEFMSIVKIPNPKNESDNNLLIVKK
jgi:hypothetical protein